MRVLLYIKQNVLSAMCVAALAITALVFVASRTVYYYGVYLSDLGQGLKVNEATFFGQSCSLAIGKKPQSIDPGQWRQIKLNFKPQPMPLAWYLSIEDRPRIKLDEFLLTKCSMDLSSQKNRAESWVSLGRIWGESYVFLNGILKGRVSDSGEMIFPILGSDCQQNSVIEVISFLNEKSDGVAGFRGGQPLFFTSNRSTLKTVQMLNEIEHGFTPVFWLNVYLMLALVVGLAWIFGIRYRDLGWIMIASSLYSLYWFIAFTPHGAVEPWRRSALFVINFGAVCALGSFAVSFLRLKIRPVLLEAIFIGLVASYAIVYLTLPADSLPRLLARYASFWVITGYLSLTIVMGVIALKTNSNKKRRNQLTAFIAVCFIYLVSHVWLGAGVVTYELVFTEISEEMLSMLFASFLMADLVVYYRRFRSEKEEKDLAISEKAQIEASSMRDSAIAQTTQMLAHDVRKPFSILKIGLDLFARAENFNELRDNIKIVTKEVDRAIASVDGMINDVMEIGRTAALNLEHVSVESIIETSIRDACRINTETDIRFKYDLAHCHMLLVDPIKVGRVFSNILSNSVQAMNGVGNIWIKSNENDGKITICLGNDGSFIPEEDLPHLFEAFFTKNKKGGTGLGLAIAKKVIHSHGEKIWCQSSREKRNVEFFFTLPVDENIKSQRSMGLPEGTATFIEGCKRIADNESLEYADDLNSPSSRLSYEKMVCRIVDQAKHLGRTIKVAIIDDEAIYRNSLKGLVDRSESLKVAINTDLFSSSNELFKSLETKSYDFIICDVDLGCDSLNGYEVVKALRDRGVKAAICIHSNRSLPEDYRRSVDVGAQAFLPKPLSQLHLVKFIAGILDPVVDDGLQIKYGKSKKGTAEAFLRNDVFLRKFTPQCVDGVELPAYGSQEGVLSPNDTDERLLARLSCVISSQPELGTTSRVAYIDDESIYREFAGKLMNDASVVTYGSPEEFIDAVEKSPELLQSFKAVFTDQNFGRLSRRKGLDLGAILKSRYKYSGVVVIVSNESICDLKDGADLCIEKPIKPWSQIKLLLDAENSKLPEVNLFQRKPYDQLTNEEIQSLSRLRHDIRGDLGSIELLFMRLESLEPKVMHKDIALVEEYFKKLMPFFPKELSEGFWRKLKVFERYPHEKTAVEDLKAAFNDMRRFHFYQDTWWATIPSSSMQQRDRSTDSVKKIGFNLKDKVLESGIMESSKKNLNVEVIVISDIDGSFDAVITDSVELMKQAVKVQIPIIFSSHRDDVESLLIKIRQCVEKTAAKTDVQLTC